MLPKNYLRQIESRGFAICPHAISQNILEELLAVTDNLAQEENSCGIRNLFKKLPRMREISNSREIRKLVDPVLGSEAFSVRAIFFDKLPEANWSVAWHQDMTIAVKERLDVPRFGPWSIKEGIVHVQPPIEILQRMLTLRIHLDCTDKTNDALVVIPRSHTYGKLSSEQVSKFVKHAAPYVCVVEATDVMAMRPLLLHSSHRAVQPHHRRVIHLEFACEPLPEPLEWFEEIA